jgi:hypothetical protein
MVLRFETDASSIKVVFLMDVNCEKKQLRRRRIFLDVGLLSVPNEQLYVLMLDLVQGTTYTYQYVACEMFI